MNSGKSEVGVRLKKLRISHRMTQREVREYLGGVPSTTYVQWENGTRNPKQDMLVAICKLFNVSLDELFGRAPLPPAPALSVKPPSKQYPIDPMTQGAEYEPEFVPLTRKIPVIGMAAAKGYDPAVIELDDLLQNSGDFTYYTGKEKDVFALRISGDSMAPKYLNGDVIAVRAMLPATGDTCVALHRKDGILCKKWFWRKGVIKLISFNPKGKSYEWKFPDFQAEQPLVWRFKVEALIWRKDSVNGVVEDDGDERADTTPQK